VQENADKTKKAGVGNAVERKKPTGRAKDGSIWKMKFWEQRVLRAAVRDR